MMLYDVIYYVMLYIIIFMTDILCKLSYVFRILV